MSETKFTKGEWAADHTHVICGNIHVADCELNSLEYTPVEEANAHLIAAAPKMYEMLELIESNILGSVSEVDLADSVVELSHDINQLLAKARGGL